MHDVPNLLRWMVESQKEEAAVALEREAARSGSATRRMTQLTLLATLVRNENTDLLKQVIARAAELHLDLN